MAIQDISLRLKMVAEGVRENVADSEKIAANYARAEKSSQGIGARRARAAAMSSSELVDYNRARANVGGTGATSRDFANQAQGLGGLVRLYATYAANVFAVGAAFRALSDAMNTTNMVRGLDQLGAASGRALGNLSKQLVEVTDGAISLREAMTSVAQTSSAGMSSQNILRLGAAAQKASQALGVSMGDALNRLSRGITKLEPELLDELGIFIRIDDAAEKYARQLGKTTGSLTEFERRQGFALAVLDQAEQKFNKLNLVANPYDKLAASVANLTQKLLEFINIGLGPVVNFLSQSPAALGAAILGIGTLILKQALPVLTMYREGLKKARDVSLASTAESSGEFRKSVVAAKQRALDLAEAEADARIKAADDADKKLRAIRESSFVKEKTKVLEILTKASQDVTQADLDYLTKQGDKNVKTNQKLAGSYYEVRDALLASKNAELSSATAQEELAKAKTKLNDNVLRSTEADLNFKKQVRRAALDESALVTANTAKQKGYFAALNAGYRDVMSKRKEIELDIPILDPKTGRATEQTEKVITKGLGNMGAALGVLRVGVAATGELLTSLVSKLGTLGIYASIAVAGFEFFNKILSSSQKESESFAKSQELLNGALKNTGATLDAILGKNIDSILSIDSVQARANAFNDLSDAILKTSKDFDKLIAAQNTWSRFFDETARFFGKTLGEIGQGFGGLTGILLRGTSKISQALFGKGAQAEYSDQLAETIMAALAVAETDIQRQSMGIALQDILGPIDLTNLENLKKQINTIPLAELGDKGIAASKAIKQISDEANNSASVLSSVRESIKTVSKEIDSLNTSLLPTDRLGKIGVGFIDTSAGLTKALADTKNGILAIKEVMDSMQVMSLLPPELAQQLIKDKEQINAVVSQLGQARETLRNIRAEIAKLPAEGGDTETIVKRTALKENQARQEKFVADLESRAASITTKYTTKIQVAVFEEGVKKLEASLKFGMQQAAIASAKAYLNVLGAVGGRTAEQETKLGLQELNIQRQVIEAQYQSKLALEKNTIAVERNTLEQAQSDLRAKVARQGGPTAEDNKKAIELSERSLTLAQKEEFLKTDPTLKKFSDARKSQNEFEKKAAMELGGLMSVMYGKQIQLAQIAGQESQVLAQGLLKEQREIAEFKNKELDLSIKSNQQSLDNITLNQSLIGIYDSGLAAQRATLEQSLIQQNAEKEINKLLADQAVLRKLEGRPDIDEKKRQEALKLLQDNEAAAKKKRDQDIVASQRKFRIDDAKQAEEFAKKERDNAFQILQANNEIYTTRLDQSLQYLQLLEAFGVEDKLSAIQQRARVDLLKEDLQLQTQLQNINNQQLGIDAKRAMIKLLAAEGAPTTALVAEADREQQLLNAQRDSILAANDARTRGIKLQAEQNIQLERQNYFLEQATKISDTLNNNFGKTGERLGQAVDGFSKIAINLEKSEKAQTDFNKRSREMTEDSSAEQWASFWEEKDRLEKKSAQDELDRNAMALSSTKKLFKEKTGAYKAFGALEKAYHIARLIMSAKEIATQIASTVSFITGSITRQTTAATEAGVLGVKAVINAISSMPFPLNLAAGAATTAVVAGLLAKIGKSFSGGGGGGGSAFVPTTQQSQEVQGTAMSYDEKGKKVQTSRGVFGDTDAKNDAIAKSIAVIEANSVDGLNYDNKVVNLLKSIDASMGGAAKSLYSMTGLRTGTSAGFSLPGTRINENWIGIDTKKISMDVREAGVYLKGSIEDIRNNIVNSVMTFQAGIRKVDFPSWRFWSKDYEEPFKELKRLGETGGPQQELLDYVQQVILGGEQALIELGKELGKTGVEALLSGVQFDANINIKDLKGDDLAKEVSAVLGAQIDKMTVAVFGEYARFAEFNETLTETVIRVFDSNRKVIQSLKNVGISSADLLKDFDGQVITELLVGLSDGLEGFLGKVEKFRDVFLTDSEKITPTVTSLKTRLQELGFTNVDTATEFKLLVQSIKPVTAESAKLLDSLLDLAPAVEQTYKAVEDMLEGLRVETINLTSTLSGDEIAIRDITIKTAEYVEKLNAAGLATEENVAKIAQWTKASALGQLRTNLKTAFDDRKRELESNISALKKVKESLLDLKNSLLIGELSPLDPLQQYDQLFKQYQQTLVNMRSTDSATADLAKQAFPQLAKELLQTGKGLFSSSQVYQAIFEQVNKDITSAGEFIDQQITAEEATLKTLNDTYASILGIETTSKSALEKLTEIGNLYKTVAGTDTTKLAADIIAGLNAGKNPVEAIAEALNAQVPILTKATAEAVLTVLGNKTVDTVLSESVSKIISDANTKADAITNAGKTGVTDVTNAGKTGVTDVTNAGTNTITKIDAAVTKIAGAATAAISTVGTAGGVALTTITTGVNALTTAQQAIIAAKSGDGGTGTGAAIDGDNAALRAASSGIGNLGGDYSHLAVAADGTLIDPAGLVLAGTADTGTLQSIDSNGVLVGKVDMPTSITSTDIATGTTDTEDVLGNFVDVIDGLTSDFSDSLSSLTSAIDLATESWQSAAQDVTDITGQFSLYSDATRDETSSSGDIIARMGGDLIVESSNLGSGWSSSGGGGDGIGGSKGMDDRLSEMNLVASGGPVMRNSPYIVGENGPELFIPKTNGTVISNTQVARNQQNSHEINIEISQKLDRLIEAVIVSNNANAQTITATLENVKSKKTWEHGQVYGRVSGQ